MTNLKRSFFWTALYLAIVFILGQTDYSGSPIINFASYFYLAVMTAIPTTLFFPSLVKTSMWIPLLVWAGIYLVLLQVVERSNTAEAGQFSVVILEFILLQLGVGFSFQLALQIGHAESLMDALAVSAFPNSIHDVEKEGERIKIEFTRSRRYHRPLSLLLIEFQSNDQSMTGEMLKSVQHDLMNRFTIARIGQIIDERIRQTDLILKDSHGRFIILCPEIDLNGVSVLADRIVQLVAERSNLRILLGAASFPDDALTFEDLLRTARERAKPVNHELPKQSVAVESN